MSHVPTPSQAVVPKDLVKYAKDVQWWTGGPEDVEKDFKDAGFPCVALNYLCELEDLFRLIREKTVKANTTKSSHVFNVRNSVLLFNGVLDATADSDGFVVSVMIMRPCCMGQGFARLMLYWMARMCHASKKNMMIRAPSSYTQALIDKAFGKVADTAERDNYITLPWKCLELAFEHLGIKPEWFANPKYHTDMDPLQHPPRLNRGSLEEGCPFPWYDDLSSGKAHAAKRARI